MINLLQFKQPDGVEHYKLYARGVVVHLEGVGGRVLYSGSARAFVIGEGERPWWDAILVVEYPSPGGVPEDGRRPGLPRGPQAPRGGAGSRRADRHQPLARLISARGSWPRVTRSTVIAMITRPTPASASSVWRLRELLGPQEALRERRRRRRRCPP